MMTKRIVPKRDFVYGGLIYFGALLFGLGLLFQMLPAHGADGHAVSKAATKHVVMKRDSWSMIRTYVAPNSTPPGTHLESYTLQISTDYLFWPDGDDVNKIAPTGGSVCYFHNTGNGGLFQGVQANPYYLDDTTVINPGPIDVDRDGNKDQKCKDWTIAVENRRWLRMGQDPAWRVQGKIRIKFSNDDDFDFKWGGSNYKYFHPGDDPEVSEWFYCECNYGAASTRSATRADGPGDAVGTMTYDEWHSIALNDTQNQVRNKCNCSGYILDNYTGPLGNFHSVLGYVGTNGTTRGKVDYLLNDNGVFVAKSSAWKNDAGRWVYDFGG